jgi:hypothetical protein
MGQHPMPPRPTAGLAKAMILLYWLTTAFALLSGIAWLNRKSTWDSFINGDGSFSDVDGADGLVAVAVLPGVALLIAGGVLTVLWWQRASAQMKRSGAALGAAARPWLALFAVGFIVMVAAWSVGRVDIQDFAGTDTVSNKLRNQGILGVIGALLYVGATVMAMRTTKRVEQAAPAV